MGPDSILQLVRRNHVSACGAAHEEARLVVLSCKDEASIHRFELGKQPAFVRIRTSTTCIGAYPCFNREIVAERSRDIRCQSAHGFWLVREIRAACFSTFSRETRPLQPVHPTGGRREYEVVVLHEGEMLAKHASVARLHFDERLPVVADLVERPVAEQSRLVAHEAFLVVGDDVRLRAGDRPHAHVRDPSSERHENVLQCSIRSGGCVGRAGGCGADCKVAVERQLDILRRAGAVQHAVEIDRDSIRGIRVDDKRHMVPSAGLKGCSPRHPATPAAVEDAGLPVVVTDEHTTISRGELSKEIVLAAGKGLRRLHPALDRVVRAIRWNLHVRADAVAVRRRVTFQHERSRLPCTSYNNRHKKKG